MTRHIGILHPGAMGISIAASAQNNGHLVYWTSQERSEQTKARAEKFNVIDVFSLDKLCQQCDILISVCPPHAAESVAQKALSAGFQGLYVDANAISPQRATRIGQSLAQAGVSYVDGGIIGGPAWEPNRTWLYLSGSGAREVAECFSAGPLMTQVLGNEINTASALKMCFAAYTKGTTALLSAILATAEHLGVREALFGQWDRDGSDFAGQTTQRVRGVTAKAWRFTGEMEEIAATFQEAGLPGDFHIGAAEVYRRMAHFKNEATYPSLEDVLSALTRTERTN